MTSINTLQTLGAISAGITGVYYLRQYFRGGVCISNVRMDDKTVLITGSNTGIGKETVLDLCRRGARVAMLCRNVEKAQEAATEIRKQVKGADIVVYKCDLSSFTSIRDCAKEVNCKEDRIDVLINNAGIYLCPFTKTEDGFEMQIGTNHFGHFLLSNLLLDKIKKCAPSRIVTLSSLAYERGQIDLDDINFLKRPYNRSIAYRQSKLANILFTRELAKRLENTGVTTYAVHPGAVYTDIGRHIEDVLGILKYPIYAAISFFLKNPTDGAQTTIECAVSEKVEKDTGKYYSDCKEKNPKLQAKDDVMARKLWDFSVKAVKLEE